MLSTSKYNFQDVTFVIPFRMDSEERKANLNTLLNLLIRDFTTNIIVLEADKTRLFNCELDGVVYRFVYDDDPIFHRTKYINQLFKLATTAIVGVWDTDAVGIPSQIFNAIEKIRNKEAVMAFPYDGRFYCADNVLSNLFRQTFYYEVLTENVSLMHLMHGYYAVGGAYIVNKEEYLNNAGGENENIYGWGPEDAERVRRMEIYNLPVYYSKGLLFHLWHPSSWYENKEIELKNRKELIKTCKNKEFAL